MGSSSPTITVNGLPSTGFPFFVTSIICLPGSSGVNSNPRLLSGVEIHSIGSFLPLGRVTTASKSFKSRGRVIPGRSFSRLQVSPTWHSGSSSSTITSNGLPFTGFPFLVTSITCLPGSSGTNSSPSVLSGVDVHSIGSFFPLGRVTVAFKSFKSPGNTTSGMS